MWRHTRGNTKRRSPFKSAGVFSRILAAEVCASAVIMLDTPCSEVEWKVLATHSNRQFPFHFPSRASTCAIILQLESTSSVIVNGRVHLNRWGRQFSRLLAAEMCASAVVMLDTPCSEVVWRVLATHSTRQFPLHLPSRASPCAITFQLDIRRYISPAMLLATHSTHQFPLQFPSRASTCVITFQLEFTQNGPHGFWGPTRPSI